VSASGDDSQPFRVLIVGAGVAGLEGALALRDLAGDAVGLTLLSPAEEFVYRPMSVREPFAYSGADHYPLAPIARDLGAELVKDALSWVDTDARLVHTEGGAALSYDALLLALGATAHARYAHALTIDAAHMDETLHGLIEDVEGGYIESLAFVVPAPMAWPMPIYELALMTAGRAYDMNIALPVTVITPEDAPLAIFGQEASAAVSRLLADAGVTTILSSYAEIPEEGRVLLTPGDRELRFARIIALPELAGPAVRGLPAGEHGFIPVDQHSKVREVERVYAAGDAVDFAVKHGGVSSQQADVAAEAIAALAGIPVDPKPFDPVVHGILLTGGSPKYLTAHITGGHGSSSTISDTPTWEPASKIAAKYLAPYLQERAERGPAARRGGEDDG